MKGNLHDEAIRFYKGIGAVTLIIRQRDCSIGGMKQRPRRIKTITF